MTINGYELTTDWKESQCGYTALAKKGDKKYFVKKYKSIVMPIDNGTLDKKTFEHNKELFNDFMQTRRAINQKIRPITGAGGNIVIPCDEFILDNFYVEVAELVAGVISDEKLEDTLAGIPLDTKQLLMQTAAGALSSVHKLGIVHSDLKLKNVLLAKNDAGNYVAKLIDFDSSYFIDKKPEEIVGDINYYSPELGIYADIEDDDERIEAGKKLTEKSDIFSLGLIFHFYLSGALPTAEGLSDRLKRWQAKGKKIYSWSALVDGARLVISPEVKGRKYRSLIEDMLKLDPAERPSALDVLKRLKAEDKAIDDPWPEHKISFDIDRIKSRGFVGIEKKTLSGINGYEFYRADGSSQFFKIDMLMAMKYATLGEAAPTSVKVLSSGADAMMSKTKPADPAPKAATSLPGDSTPWPEHGITFDMDMIHKKGFNSISRDTLSGVKGYKLIKADGTEQFMRVEMLIVQKMASK